MTKPTKPDKLFAFEITNGKKMLKSMYVYNADAITAYQKDRERYYLEPLLACEYSESEVSHSDWIKAIRETLNRFEEK